MMKPTLVDLKQMPWQPHPDFAGLASKFFPNSEPHAPSDVLIAELGVGAEIPWHVHQTESEVAYVLQGKGILYSASSEQREDVMEQSLTQGSAVIVPPQTWHCLVNTGEEIIRLFALHT